MFSCSVFFFSLYNFRVLSCVIRKILSKCCCITLGKDDINLRSSLVKEVNPGSRIGEDG